MKKLKFKSVFIKYTIVFMAVIILTATILGVMVTTIVGKYTLESRQKQLYDANLLFKTSVLGFGGEYDREERFIAPTLLDNVSPDAPIMAGNTIALRKS